MRLPPLHSQTDDVKFREEATDSVFHPDHCVDYLRNRLMCLSDMGIIPYFWYENEGDLVGDMSRTFTCRNYESVRQFVKANAQKADGRAKPKEGDYVLWDYI